MKLINNHKIFESKVNNMKMCEICLSVNTKRIIYREMMYQSNELFTYKKCQECCSLSLVDIPEDWTRYYSNNYYSFNDNQSNIISIIKDKFKLQMYLYTLYKKNPIGKILLRFFSEDLGLKALTKVPHNENSKILDVGSGTGSFLIKLSQLGFKKAIGIDPFIENSIEEKTRTIFKKSIYNIKQKFDIIMFNHSFEHLPDPAKVLEYAITILNKNGHIIIRMPISNSFADRKFGKNWVQIDPPRHIFVFSVKGFERFFARTIGSKAIIKEITFDSFGFQFWGSLLAMKNIPNAGINPHSEFRKAQLKYFNMKSKELNKQNDGDQAAIIIKLNR